MATTLREVLQIAAAELRSLLRDRHTLIYSIAVPIFLYPIIFLSLTQVLTIARGAADRRVGRVAILPGEAPAGLREAIAARARLRLVPVPVPVPGVAVPGAPGGSGEALAESLLRARIASGDLEAAIDPIPAAPSPLHPGLVPRLRILHSSAREASSAARREIDEALEELRDAERRRLAEASGIDASLIAGPAVDAADITPREVRLRDALARAIPLFIILMTAIGAIYPALDVTVGERERRTVETTLLAPVERRSLILGKFLPVALFGFLSALLNLASMAVALGFFIRQAGLRISLGPISTTALLTAIGAATAAALLIGAAMMAVALFARSFKEGQSYLGPILLLCMAPGMAALIEEVRLTPALAAVPLLNLALALRDALQERLDPVLGAFALASGAAWTLLAMAFAARLAREETILLGEGPARRRRLFSWRGASEPAARV